MGIEAIWKSESGEELAAVYDPHMLLSEFASDSALLSHTTCLRFLDPCGDACFNHMQVPVLRTELASFVRAMPEGALRTHLQAVLSLCHRAVRAHTYLWFVGD
jgi:hypothetical protein